MTKVVLSWRVYGRLIGDVTTSLSALPARLCDPGRQTNRDLDVAAVLVGCNVAGRTASRLSIEFEVVRHSRSATARQPSLPQQVDAARTARSTGNSTFVKADVAPRPAPDDPSSGFSNFRSTWFTLQKELLDAVVQFCANLYATLI